MEFKQTMINMIVLTLGSISILKIKKKMNANKKGGEKKSGGFDVDLKADGGLMQMMGGFTVLRLTSMMGMVNVEFTKEELLKMNKQLNRIKKVR